MVMEQGYFVVVTYDTGKQQVSNRMTFQTAQEYRDKYIKKSNVSRCKIERIYAVRYKDRSMGYNHRTQWRKESHR